MASMERTDSSAAIQSLVSAYTETEDAQAAYISGSDDEDTGGSNIGESKTGDGTDAGMSAASSPAVPPPAKARKLNRLVSYATDDIDDDDDDHDAEEEGEEVKLINLEEEHEHDENDIHGKDFSSSLNAELASSLSTSIMNMNATDVQIPPAPVGNPSKKVQEKIQQSYEKMQKQGFDLNSSIQRRKDFRNPSIYDKLIEFIGIDEKGTNFPKSLYNPAIWGPDSYYDELARLQKLEMEKREKERKERTKIEFKSGTKKPEIPVEVKRKSKWDAQPTAPSNLPVVSSVTKAGGKTTVISAIGMIKKTK